ncbi:MAG: sigma-70 family RNA polymerase sigma factor, partial [Myxococcales bacterium]|nr:sigma-70 family RNA polymerase sigma factor [Myxococcales bacterium]
IAMAILGDAAEAHDVAQDAFLRAWRRLGTLQRPERFRSWLYEIARNAARDRLRRRGARDRMLSQVSTLGVADAAAPSEDLEGRELSEHVAQALRSLDADQREVLLLHDGGSRSAKEIAELLGVSHAAVRKRLSRARQRVREGLPEEWRRSLAVARRACLAALAVQLWPPRAAVAAPLRASVRVPVVAGAGAMLGASLLYCAAPSTQVEPAAQVAEGSPSVTSAVRLHGAEGWDERQEAEPGPGSELTEPASGAAGLPPAIEVMLLEAQLQGQTLAACPHGGVEWDYSHPSTSLRIPLTTTLDDTLYLVIDEEDSSQMEGVVPLVDGRQARIVVHDDGVGPAACEVVFEPGTFEPAPRDDVPRSSEEAVVISLSAALDEALAELPDGTTATVTGLSVSDADERLLAEVMEHPDLSEEGRAYAEQMLEERRLAREHLLDEAEALGVEIMEPDEGG